MDIRISTIDAYIIEMMLPTIHQRVLDKITSIHEKAVPMPSLGVIHHRLHVIAEQGSLDTADPKVGTAGGLELSDR